MDYDRTDTTKNRTILLIVGAVAFVSIIVALSMLISRLSNDDSGITIVNENNITQAEESSIRQEDYNLVKKQLRNLLTEQYNVPENEEIRALIRESTYIENGSEGEKVISFTLDVENVKVTYYVLVGQGSENVDDVSISCAPASDSKYPETFCIGLEDSSIDVNMGADLPYYYKENDEVKFEISHEDYGTSLILSVNATCDDEEATKTAKSKMKEWIRSYRLDPEQVPIEEDKSSCKAYEDGLKRKDLNSHGSY